MQVNASEIIVDAEQFYDLQHELFELKKRQEKYKWHKKPENGWTEETLPKTYEAIIFETSIERLIGEMRENKEFYSSDYNCKCGIESKWVYAWKYYEPFEESD